MRIRIILWRCGKNPQRWKSRRAGVRALRYLLYMTPSPSASFLPQSFPNHFGSAGKGADNACSRPAVTSCEQFLSHEAVQILYCKREGSFLVEELIRPPHCNLLPLRVPLLLGIRPENRRPILPIPFDKS
jgi:hypothetical protein